MLPSLSTELAPPTLHSEHQRQLLAFARAAIADAGHTPSDINLGALPESLQRERAVFVTLMLNGRLRGCIGSLAATMPLALAVADAARGAARRDPRFPPLRPEEMSALRIEVSVLSELEPLATLSRRELLASLRPGVDGLLLEDGSFRSTFLPKVWSQLPEAEEFLSQLLAKAGLPSDHWSSGLRAYRYTVSSFTGSYDRDYP